jgi:hypothetical protein
VIFLYKKLSKTIQIFSFGLFVVFILILFTSLTSFLGLKNNLFLNYLISILDCILFSITFVGIFKNILLKKWLYRTSFFIIIFTIFDAFKISGIDKLTTYSNTSKTFFIIILLIIFIFKLFETSDNIKIFKVPLFWIAVIKIFVASVGLISEPIQVYLFENRLFDYFYISNCIQFFVQGLCFLLYTIPIWMDSQDHKYSNLQL